MKYLFLETEYDYESYKFPYKVYLERENESENESETNDIFNSGFLPTRIRNNLFYLCRSLRVNLSKFETSSENRRILRKTQYLDLTLLDMGNFGYNYKIGKKAVDFYKDRFGKKVISAQKIKWIFNSGFFNGLLKFNEKADRDKLKNSKQDSPNNKAPLAYCPVMKTDKLIFYAYPFYNLDFFDKNIGMGMMTRAIKFAKENNFEYVYLGTIYTKSAIYKLQFEGLEYFDGIKWNTDIEKLKQKIRNKQNIKYKISEIV